MKEAAEKESSVENGPNSIAIPSDRCLCSLLSL